MGLPLTGGRKLVNKLKYTQEDKDLVASKIKPLETIEERYALAWENATPAEKAKRALPANALGGGMLDEEEIEKLVKIARSGKTQ